MESVTEAVCDGREPVSHERWAGSTLGVVGALGYLAALGARPRAAIHSFPHGWQHQGRPRSYAAIPAKSCSSDPVGVDGGEESDADGTRETEETASPPRIAEEAAAANDARGSQGGQRRSRRPPPSSTQPSTVPPCAKIGGGGASGQPTQRSRVNPSALAQRRDRAARERPTDPAAIAASLRIGYEASERVTVWTVAGHGAGGLMLNPGAGAPI